MKKRGGKREGSGRPKKPENILKEETKQAISDAREFLVTNVKKDLDVILTAQLNAAKGITVAAKEMKLILDAKGRPIKDHTGTEVREWTGEYVTAYFVVPDLKTGEYLINQVAGKPMETLEIGGKNGKPIEVNVTNMSMDEVDQALQKLLNKKK